MTKKIFLTAYILFFTITVYCQTADQWQEDLRHLQKMVHLNYSNLFYNISAKEWDKAVDDFNASIPDLNSRQILVGFIKLVALFHIGHTQMNTFSLHGEKVKEFGLHRYPYQLYRFTDGLYILRADSKYANAVGGKVIKIGNMKAEDALEAVRPLVSYENEQGFRSNGPFFLATPEFMQVQGITNTADEVAITYSRNGKEETTIFKAGGDNGGFSNTGLAAPEGWTDAKQAGNGPLWQKEPTAFRYMEFLPDTKTLYVRHTVTIDQGQNTIASFFNNMADFIDRNDVQKLVLDIRMNGGGNNTLNKPIITNIIASKKINQKGRFFCIIGRRTFSAAQNLVNELEKYTEVTFVGEPTSENGNFFGDTKTEILPNSKLQANLSWLWWQNLDPRDKRKATAPQVAVDMTFADYYNNNDPAFNAVFNYEKMKPLIPTLKELINAGKKNEALQFAFEYKNDPIHRYYVDRIETSINAEAYKYMDSKPETANIFLELNIKLFPGSANAYNSYAESLLKLGNTDEAVKNYEMAIAKDRDGAIAENSKKMIEKIKNDRK